MPSWKIQSRLLSCSCLLAKRSSCACCSEDRWFIFIRMNFQSYSSMLSYIFTVRLLGVVPPFFFSSVRLITIRSSQPQTLPICSLCCWCEIRIFCNPPNLSAPTLIVFCCTWDCFSGASSRTVAVYLDFKVVLLSKKCDYPICSKSFK